MDEIYGAESYAPKEVAERIETVDVKKANLPLIPMAPLGVLAGSFIGLGALFYTLVASDGSLGFAVQRVLGGAVFSLGLILVVVAGVELFTGNNLMVIAWVDRQVPVDNGSRKRELFFPFTIGTWRKFAFSHDRARLYIGTDSTVEVLDLKRADFLTPIDLVADPNAPRIIRRSGLNGSTGDGFQTIQRRLSAIAVSSRGVVAIGGQLGEVRLWDAETHQLLMR